MAKKVLVVCGTGGITSTIAEKEIIEAAKREGIPITTSRVTPLEVSQRDKDVDLIVTTTALRGTYNAPVINALAFITGVGKAKVLEQIISFLKK